MRLLHLPAYIMRLFKILPLEIKNRLRQYQNNLGTACSRGKTPDRRIKIVEEEIPAYNAGNRGCYISGYMDFQDKYLCMVVATA